ncbi:uncharacterized protein [Blastocystis hominis]|uniref:Uncharacterized protein n=1 Tax=Blastocystis hominis TaxID=12968 RepID=D8LYG1_BLAHO|nr:uncharacterized protein [Blastocystis hominis]CBK20616.2 unnamed protein product [Blastocystis hominis]|eukprot:XP_012894664.1 uncharacterized protein [Blastocystis hominis]
MSLQHPKLQFHVFFNPQVSLLCKQCLRDEKALVDVSIYSLNLLLFPFENDLVSQELSDCCYRMFSKKDRTAYSSILESIRVLQSKSGGISEIHGIGDRAVFLLESIQKQKNKFLQCETDASNPPIRHLILVDRSVDFNSLFVTPLTYEGLIDEVLGIQTSSVSVRSSVIGRRGEGTESVLLSNDDYLFSEIRNKNIAVIPQALQNKLYEMQMETSNSGRKLPSKQDSFDQLQIHQGVQKSGISDLITNVTNGYQFRQRWQMEHEILEGEQLLDYIVERITLQDALPLILRLLVLYSLVNSGLRGKDYDAVRKEIIQVGSGKRGATKTYGYSNLLTLYNLERAGLLGKREGGKNYAAIRNKLQLVKDVGGENAKEMQ